MTRFSSLFFGILIFLILMPFLANPSFAYYTNMPANVVVGQPDFSSNTATVTARDFDQPLSVTSDGKHFIVQNGHRVLIYNNIPAQNYASADVVLGQPDFTSNTANNGGISARTLNCPCYVATDGTRLAVADNTNNRILIWNSIPTANQQAADVVVGQPDFATTSGGTTASKFNGPTGVTFYNGKLITIETGSGLNNRVLIFNSIPTTNGASADVVVGQTDFTSSSTGTSATKFNDPRGVVVANNKLVVADPGNRRVLIFNSIPTTNGISADVVIGQPDFISSTSDNGGITCSSLNGGVFGVVALNNNRLLVGDSARALIFNQIPTTNFTCADIVLGQPDFVTRVGNYGGLSARSMADNPIRAGIEVDGKLILPDQVNRRVLIFENTFSNPRLGLTSIEGGDDGKIRVKGTVRVDGGNYNIWKLLASVNGGDYGGVTNLSNSVSSGSRHNPGSTASVFSDFYHDLEPWNFQGKSEGNGTKDEWKSNRNRMENERGYTFKLKGYNNNADSNEALFFFTPFGINSPSNTLITTNNASSTPTNQNYSSASSSSSSSSSSLGYATNKALPLISKSSSVSFSVNKYQRTELKENLDHYEVWVKQVESSKLKVQSEGSWLKYIDSIPIDFDHVKDYSDNLKKGQRVTGSNPGDGNGVYENENIIVSYSNNSATVSVRKKGSKEGTVNLTNGVYQVKVSAVDKHGSTQDTGTVTVRVIGNTTSQTNKVTTKEWFPLQINKITGSSIPVISSFNPPSLTTVSIPSYPVSTLTPTITGIAVTNATVTLAVTDQQTGAQRTYTVKADNSTFSLTPTLYATSFVDLSVEDDSGRYGEIGTISLALLQ